MTWLLCASETRRGRRRGGGGGRKRRGREREVGTFEVGWSQLNETEEKKEL